MSYVAAPTNLPRSLDVVITVSNPQTERRTNLSIPCYVGENLGFLPNASRIRFYSTIEALEADFAAGTDAHKAASAFFAQTPRATTMAVGEAFTANQAARVVSGAVLTAAELTALELVTDGSMKITINGVEHSLAAITFDGITTMANVATKVNTALGEFGSCEMVTFPGDSVGRLVITSATAGDASTITFPTTGASGTTSLATLLKLTEATGATVLQGYTVGDLPSELTEIQNAAKAAGSFIYGWVLGAGFRTVETQLLCATWALARTAVMPLVSNDLDALDPNTDTDLGASLLTSNNRRVSAIWHSDPDAFPDMSILAYMLSVNYQLKDSTVTAKFKPLPGIDTVAITETQWATLKAKGYDTYTSVGSNSLTFRDGTTEASSWYLDTLINIDNFVEDLSVNVYNVFLRNKKVPYTRMGAMLLVDACRDTGAQYKYNGSFADREVADTSNKSGFKVVPAVVVEATPISQMSMADRAGRVGPPIAITVQEAGAIHSIAINVDVVS